MILYLAVFVLGFMAGVVVACVVAAIDYMERFGE